MKLRFPSNFDRRLRDEASNENLRGSDIYLRRLCQERYRKMVISGKRHTKYLSDGTRKIWTKSNDIVATQRLTRTLFTRTSLSCYPTTVNTEAESASYLLPCSI